VASHPSGQPAATSPPYLATSHPEEKQNDQVERVDHHAGHQTNSHCVHIDRDQVGNSPIAGENQERAETGVSTRTRGQQLSKEQDKTAQLGISDVQSKKRAWAVLTDDTAKPGKGES